MHFSKLVKKKNIVADLQGTEREGVLREMLARLRENGEMSEKDADQIFSGLMARERLGTTGIGRGIAIPHVRFDGLKDLLVAVGRSGPGVDYAAVDGGKVKVVFLVVTPAAKQDDYLAVLRYVSSIARDDYNNKLLMGAQTAKDFVEIFQDIEEND
ncbi:MAG: PTS sugar transporter subunit IIA [Planctomycetes bacterium]|jgi:PTS system nitrogen regulatory IIA component|nr:PTS sugar transporter subunit IIA [Planctomycetota bacterium]